MAGGDGKVPALQAFTDGVGARGVGHPRGSLVRNLAPQAGLVFHLTVDVGDEVVDALVSHEQGDVVVVHRAGQYLAQVAVYLLRSLGAEGLVAEVGIGMDGECLLLRVELAAHELAGAYLHVGRLVAAEVGLQALLHHLLLRLGREGGAGEAED